MKCTWQKLSRLAALRREYSLPFNNFSFRPRYLATQVATLPQFSTPIVTARQNNVGTEKEMESCQSHQSKAHLSSAQLGRAAASAIRLSVQERNLTDAYLIVNSVRYAGVLHTATDLPGIESMEDFRSVALAFTNDVSPRLPSHTLLHGLIRLGMHDKASTLAEQMMAAGISVRCKTLEALFQGLAEMSARNGKRDSEPAITANMLKTKEILTLRMTMTNDVGTQFALRLLSLARKSRQRRSSNMFRTLIALCIINGEIIIASLLFGYLVRDWQARELHKLSSHETPRPFSEGLQSICQLADTILAQDYKGQVSKLHYDTALQALANLAYLLDRNLIPSQHISCLIVALYNCPRTDDKVWVPDWKDVPRYIKAYPYFHQVLKRFIDTMPSRNPIHNPKSPHFSKGNMTPIPAPFTYNSLLHYALHHRHSFPLAEKILHHMEHLREPPLHAGRTAKNIILRYTRLSRKKDVNEGRVGELFREAKAEHKYKAVKGGLTSGPVTFAADKSLVKNANDGDISGTSHGLSDAISPTTRKDQLNVHSASATALTVEVLPVPSQFESTSVESTNSPERASVNDVTTSAEARSVVTDLAKSGDNHALNEFLSYLIATGKPHLVIEVVPSILPGMLKSDYPDREACQNMSEPELADLCRDIQRKGLEKAVQLGPVVFTTILNAVEKCGKLGLGEKVWHWAKAAEERSWVRTGDAPVKPWCLPVHAYTVMLTLYGDERSKAMSLTAQRMPKRIAFGWGWGWRKKNRVRLSRFKSEVKRNTARLARIRSIQTYGALWASAEKVKAKLIQLQQEDVPVLVRKHYLEIPRPDARFFNAIMNIVGREPYKFRVVGLRSRAHYVLNLRKARYAYLRHGHSPATLQDGVLFDVANDMTQAGIPIPLLHRRFLVGHWNNLNEKYDWLDRRPYAASQRLPKKFRLPGLVRVPIVHTKRKPNVEEVRIRELRYKTIRYYGEGKAKGARRK